MSHFSERMRIFGQHTILGPDDVLLLQLSIKVGSEKLNLRLTVNVVEAPVIPAPEAAYALLRWQQMEGNDQVV